MSTSHEEDDYAAIAEKLYEKMTAENPGLFVSRDVCNERHEGILRQIKLVADVIIHVRAMTFLTILGIIATVVVILIKG